MIASRRRVWIFVVMLISWLAPTCCIHAQAASSSSLPDAPRPASTAQAPTRQATGPARFTQVIEPGEQAPLLSPGEKMKMSLRRSVRPIVLAPALLSAGWAQLIDGDPKYGSDSGAFGERFGAAMLSAAITRTLSDGVFASLFHQDPRYYRIAHGSIVHRGLLSAEQEIERRSDSGTIQPNYSAFAGKLASAALAMTYYPPPSRSPGVVAETFATSIATGVGGNLVLEFLPDIARHVPILEKMHLE